MLSRELRSQCSSEVESRMPLQTARTGSERGVRATLKRATGPYSTYSRAIRGKRPHEDGRSHCFSSHPQRMISHLSWKLLFSQPQKESSFYKATVTAHRYARLPRAQRCKSQDSARETDTLI